MRILYLFPQFPYPPDSGGKIVTYNMIRHLSKNHQITLWAFAQDRRDYENVAELAPYCDKIELFPPRRRMQPLSLLRTVFGRYPYKANRWRSAALAKRLRQQIEVEHYDIIHAQNLTMAQYLTGRESGATVYYKENLEALILQRYADLVRIAPLRWAMRREAAKTLRLELHLSQLCDQLMVISSADGDRLRQMDPSLDPAHIPAGVDVEYYSPASQEPEPATILFSGSMYYYPNKDGALWFAEHVWSRVRAALPDARCLFAGQKPGRMIRALHGRSGIEVHPDVPDMRPYYHRATVYVAPLRVGGGMRLKILEAMAMGKAIVSTSIGAEAIEYTPGRHLLPADDPERFAEQIVQLCKTPSLRKSMESDAREWVVQNYRWESIMARLEEVYRELEYDAHFLRKTSSRVR